MSTTKRAKAARMAAHTEEKKHKEREKLFGAPTKRKSRKEFKEYKPKEVYVRETKSYPSITTSNPAITGKKEPMWYTGDLICGIATMHKSNAVPVMRGTKQAEEIAKMRRN